MRTLKLRVATVAILLTLAVPGLPLVAYAHTGGALDAEGCHADHRTGTYHCHRGAAAGYTFPNRAAMQESVRTGTFPEKSVDEEGFFEKLWPFGKKHEQQAEPAESEPAKAEPARDATTGSADTQAVAPVPAPSAGASGAAAPADAAPPAVAAPAAPVGVAAPAAAAAPQTEQEKRLKVLQGLYEMGLITKEEYEAKRKEVLDTL